MFEHRWRQHAGWFVYDFPYWDAPPATHGAAYGPMVGRPAPSILTAIDLFKFSPPATDAVSIVAESGLFGSHATT